ncbi:hypothetical protein M8C21_014954 [Ambrosia artemisiifolia]|uniref:DC-UbP/UBTD2 N-terminal domain-containing protein n=1 Tax=Ambrosia artemisiifolia TaxID=4212 RepID=A0AAD5CKE3_AMBAR|nr:hypothetical protein M8C21_014954 [Ambrosia artemisiifolia]
MSVPLLYLFFSFYLFLFQSHAAPPAAPVIKQLSSILKWTAARSSSKSPLSDGGSILQFEDGYLVETVVEGNQLGVVPYSIRVSQDGELYAVDSVNSNIVRITPPLSQYSRARLIAGSFQGYTGHVDGKPNDARFDHPKGVTMDDKGNVYVADTTNLAIRKIGEAGVTTIAGGKSNVGGYRDGPSEDAQFSSDFDVIYVRPTCSLLVVDRGNAALRQIALNQEDCDFHDNSVSSIDHLNLHLTHLPDLVLVIGAILIGYLVCVLQQGYGSSYFTKPDKAERDTKRPKKESLTKSQTVETVKEEQEAGWPSFSQLVVDLSKLVLEGFGNIFASFNPFARRGLTPLKDRLIMPEDEPVHRPALAQKHRTPTPVSETRHVHNPNEKHPEITKPVKLRSSSVKDPNKHRVSKREEYAEFYGPNGEVTHVRSKSQKERTKHRVKEKRSEAVHVEQKPVDLKPVNYDDPKFSYMRNKCIKKLYHGLAGCGWHFIQVMYSLKMGCSGSSLNKRDRTTKKLRKPKPWEFPRPVTWSQLVQMRDEFWDSAPHHGGKKEIWDAIHAAAEADIELAQTILDSAGVIVHKPDMTVPNIKYQDMY